MKLGMIWFDNDPKADLETKLKRAFDYYQEKYKKAPTFAQVHPTMLTLPEGEERYTSPLGLTVEASRSILPNNFWVGVEF